MASTGRKAAGSVDGHYPEVRRSACGDRRWPTDVAAWPSPVQIDRWKEEIRQFAHDDGHVSVHTFVAYLAHEYNDKVPPACCVARGRMLYATTSDRQVRGVEIISEELAGNLFAAADIDGSQSLDFDEARLRRDQRQ